MTLKFISLDFNPALLMGSKAWELSPDEKSWVEADLTEVSYKGAIFSPEKFSAKFGKLPPLPIEIMNAYACHRISSDAGKDG